MVGDGRVPAGYLVAAGPNGWNGDGRGWIGRGAGMLAVLQLSCGCLGVAVAVRRLPPSY